MTIRQQIGRAVAKTEMETRATEFARLAHAILKHVKFEDVIRAIDQPRTLGSGLGYLADIVRNAGLTQISRTELQQKATQNPQSLGVDTAFQNYVAISNGFLGSLLNAGTFDAMLSSMAPLPLQNATVGYVSTAATAYSLNELDMKPLSRLSISSQNSDPVKTVCMIEFTKELVKFGGPGTLQLIENEMRKAVAKVTDEKFINIIS